MDRLIHTSLSAMRAAMQRQTTTANNLANVNTAGFRADMAAVTPLYFDGPGFDARVPASQGVVSADMKPGSVTMTGRPLDVALEGDALLGVQASNGDEAYTRRGDLQLSDSGLLTTGDGAPVLGESGPITLPPADTVSIDAEGTIRIVPAGGDAKNPQVVDKLKLVSPKGSKVEKGLDGLFREVNGGALPSDPTARVTNGSIESSNVNATSALIDMIEASRSWETQVKLLTTAQDLDRSGSDLMRLPD